MVNEKFVHFYLMNKTSVHELIVRAIFLEILTKISTQKGPNLNFTPVFMKNPIFSEMNSPTEKVWEQTHIIF